ncbi:MAG TPA: NlpC/P60 family protein [Candidatus Paceibacterota bacterium]
MNIQECGRYRLTIPSARILVAPEIKAHTDTQILFGEEVELLEGGELFAQVHAATDEKIGWVQWLRQAFEPASSLPPATHRVKTPRASVFSAPDAKSPRVAVLAMNSLISAGSTLPSQGEEFVEVQCFAGGNAWIRSNQLRPVKDFVTDFVAVQEEFIGTIYGWGERDANPGIDCSALLVQSLLTAGWSSCPRDTKDQVEVLGEAIEPSTSLLRGDLVFWKGHVATMVNSNDCIHSTDLAPHHRVLIQPLADVVHERRDAGLGEITRVRRLSH